MKKSHGLPPLEKSKVRYLPDSPSSSFEDERRYTQPKLQKTKKKYLPPLTSSGKIQATSSGGALAGTQTSHRPIHNSSSTTRLSAGPPHTTIIAVTASVAPTPTTFSSKIGVKSAPAKSYQSVSSHTKPATGKASNSGTTSSSAKPIKTPPSKHSGSAHSKPVSGDRGGKLRQSTSSPNLTTKPPSGNRRNTTKFDWKVRSSNLCKATDIFGRPLEYSKYSVPPLISMNSCAIPLNKPHLNAIIQPTKIGPTFSRPVCTHRIPTYTLPHLPACLRRKTHSSMRGSLAGRKELTKMHNSSNESRKSPPPTGFVAVPKTPATDILKSYEGPPPEIGSRNSVFKPVIKATTIIPLIPIPEKISLPPIPPKDIPLPPLLVKVPAATGQAKESSLPTKAKPKLGSKLHPGVTKTSKSANPVNQVSHGTVKLIPRDKKPPSSGKKIKPTKPKAPPQVNGPGIPPDNSKQSQMISQIKPVSVAVSKVPGNPSVVKMKKLKKNVPDGRSSTNSNATKRLSNTTLPLKPKNKDQQLKKTKFVTKTKRKKQAAASTGPVKVVVLPKAKKIIKRKTVLVTRKSLDTMMKTRAVISRANAIKRRMLRWRRMRQFDRTRASIQVHKVIRRVALAALNMDLPKPSLESEFKRSVRMNDVRREKRMLLQLFNANRMNIKRTRNLDSPTSSIGEPPAIPTKFPVVRGLELLKYKSIQRRIRKRTHLLSTDPGQLRKNKAKTRQKLFGILSTHHPRRALERLSRRHPIIPSVLRAKDLIRRSVNFLNWMRYCCDRPIVVDEFYKTELRRVTRANLRKKMDRLSKMSQFKKLKNSEMQTRNTSVCPSRSNHVQQKKKYRKTQKVRKASPNKGPKSVSKKGEISTHASGQPKRDKKIVRKKSSKMVHKRRPQMSKTSENSKVRHKVEKCKSKNTEKTQLPALPPLKFPAPQASSVCHLTRSKAKLLKLNEKPNILQRKRKAPLDQPSTSSKLSRGKVGPPLKKRKLELECKKKSLRKTKLEIKKFKAVTLSPALKLVIPYKCQKVRSMQHKSKRSHSSMPAKVRPVKKRISSSIAHAKISQNKPIITRTAQKKHSAVSATKPKVTIARKGSARMRLSTSTKSKQPVKKPTTGVHGLYTEKQLRYELTAHAVTLANKSVASIVGTKHRTKGVQYVKSWFSPNMKIQQKKAGMKYSAKPANRVGKKDLTRSDGQLRKIPNQPESKIEYPEPEQDKANALLGESLSDYDLRHLEVLRHLLLTNHNDPRQTKSTMSSSDQRTRTPVIMELSKLINTGHQIRMNDFKPGSYPCKGTAKTESDSFLQPALRSSPSEDVLKLGTPTDFSLPLTLRSASEIINTKINQTHLTSNDLEFLLCRLELQQRLFYTVPKPTTMRNKLLRHPAAAIKKKQDKPVKTLKSRKEVNRDRKSYKNKIVKLIRHRARIRSRPPPTRTPPLRLIEHSIGLVKYLNRLQDSMNSISTNRFLRPGLMPKPGPYTPIRKTLARPYRPLSSSQVHRILSGQSCKLASFVGYDEAAQGTDRAMASITRNFLERIANNLKLVSEREAVGGAHGFGDPIERVLYESADGVEGLRNFYRTNVTDYRRSLLYECTEQTQEIIDSLRAKMTRNAAIKDRIKKAAQEALVKKSKPTLKSITPGTSASKFQQRKKLKSGILVKKDDQKRSLKIMTAAEKGKGKIKKTKIKPVVSSSNPKQLISPVKQSGVMVQNASDQVIAVPPLANKEVTSVNASIESPRPFTLKVPELPTAQTSKYSTEKDCYKQTKLQVAGLSAGPITSSKSMSKLQILSLNSKPPKSSPMRASISTSNLQVALYSKPLGLPTAQTSKEFSGQTSGTRVQEAIDQVVTFAQVYGNKASSFQLSVGSPRQFTLTTPELATVKTLMDSSDETSYKHASLQVDFLSAGPTTPLITTSKVAVASMNSKLKPSPISPSISTPKLVIASVNYKVKPAPMRPSISKPKLVIASVNSTPKPSPMKPSMSKPKLVIASVNSTPKPSPMKPSMSKPKLVIASVNSTLKPSPMKPSVPTTKLVVASYSKRPQLTSVKTSGDSSRQTSGTRVQEVIDQVVTFAQVYGNKASSFQPSVGSPRQFTLTTPELATVKTLMDSSDEKRPIRADINHAVQKLAEKGTNSSGLCSAAKQLPTVSAASSTKPSPISSKSSSTLQLASTSKANLPSLTSKSAINLQAFPSSAGPITSSKPMSAPQIASVNSKPKPLPMRSSMPTSKLQVAGSNSKPAMSSKTMSKLQAASYSKPKVPLIVSPNHKPKVSPITPSNSKPKVSPTSLSNSNPLRTPIIPLGFNTRFALVPSIPTTNLHKVHLLHDTDKKRLSTDDIGLSTKKPKKKVKPFVTKSSDLQLCTVKTQMNPLIITRKSNVKLDSGGKQVMVKMQISPQANGLPPGSLKTSSDIPKVSNKPKVVSNKEIKEGKKSKQGAGEPARKRMKISPNKKLGFDGVSGSQSVSAKKHGALHLDKSNLLRLNFVEQDPLNEVRDTVNLSSSGTTSKHW